MNIDQQNGWYAPVIYPNEFWLLSDKLLLPLNEREKALTHPPAHPPTYKQMDIDQQTGWFAPVIYPNEFWLLSDKLIPLNESVKTVPLSLRYEPVGFFKWQMQVRLSPPSSLQMSSSHPPTLPPTTDPTGCAVESPSLLPLLHQGRGGGSE